MVPVCCAFLFKYFDCLREPPGQPARSLTFQLAEFMVSRGLFQQILNAIAALRPPPTVRC